MSGNDYHGEHLDLDDFDDHGGDCDCEECRYEWHLQECGQLPKHLGGGCQLAGTEYCDFECPFREESEVGDE